MFQLRLNSLFSLTQQEQATTSKTGGKHWQSLMFSNDGQTEKFRKLMGIKSAEELPGPDKPEESLNRKQEEIFRNLDKQYAVARASTHTHRGTGLGFGS